MIQICMLILYKFVAYKKFFDTYFSYTNLCTDLVQISFVIQICIEILYLHLIQLSYTNYHIQICIYIFNRLKAVDAFKRQVASITFVAS